MRCKLAFKNFQLDLIAVHTDFQKFRAWPYCGANRLRLIAMQQYTFFSFPDLNERKIYELTHKI